MRQVVCDRCRRPCHGDDFTTVTVSGHRGSYGSPHNTELHLCWPRDGGSVGCAQIVVPRLTKAMAEDRQRVAA